MNEICKVKFEGNREEPFEIVGSKEFVEKCLCACIDLADKEVQRLSKTRVRENREVNNNV